MGGSPSLELGKESMHRPCSSEELFFAERNGGHKGKISVVVAMVLVVFIGFLYLPPAWKFFFEAKKVLQRFSFGRGSGWVAFP